MKLCNTTALHEVTQHTV